MRGIKFRAWDKDNKEMIYQSENTTKPNGIMEAQFTFDEMGAWIFTRNYGEQVCNEVKNFELMQYTGLKDKNGKEIYEGDIDGSDEPMYVVFENGSFGLKYKDMPNYFDTCIDWNRVEIIGNIYENPELLK
jgi:hypothetical protein